MISFKTKIRQGSQKNFLLQRINTTANLAYRLRQKIKESSQRTIQICFSQTALKQLLLLKMAAPVSTLQVLIKEAIKEAMIEEILPHLIIRILEVATVIPLLNNNQGQTTLTIMEIIMLGVVINIENSCLLCERKQYLNL